MTHLGDVITTTTTTTAVAGTTTAAATQRLVPLPRPVTPLDALGLALA